MPKRKAVTVNLFRTPQLRHIRIKLAVPVRLLVGISGASALIVLGSSGTALGATSPAGAGSQRYIVVLKGNVSATQVLQDAKPTVPRRSAPTVMPFRDTRLTFRPTPGAAPRRTRTWPWWFPTALSI